MRQLPVLPEHVRRAADVLDSLAAPDERHSEGGSAKSPANGAPEADSEPLVWLQVPNIDKYAWEGHVSIDCESRIHLCRAACCGLRFPLSEQDLLEGVAAWDPQHPYMNAQDDSGQCVHHDLGSGRCSIYEKRPLPCRAFDCRADRRIWHDFENRIPNPELGTNPLGANYANARTLS